MASVSAPDGSIPNGAPFRSKAGSTSAAAEGIGRPDMARPLAPRRGMRRTRLTVLPCNRSWQIVGPMSGRGMTLAPSTFASGRRCSRP